MPAEVRAIRIFAILTLLFTVYSSWSLRLFFLATFTGRPVGGWSDIGHPAEAMFLLAAGLFQLAVGAGVLAGARWSYWLLRGWLYLWLVAFPIGTLIAWPLLQRMRREDVRRHFGLGPAPA